MGGNSSERKISIETGNQVLNALKNYDLKPRKFLIGSNIKKFVIDMINFSPDIVFNALHGRFGEDGQVQSILNSLQIPYTHSGATSSAIAINKHFSKIIFRNSGIPCPKSELVEIDKNVSSELSLPMVLKPVDGGSSIDVVLIRNQTEFEKKSKSFFQSNKLGMFEEYIPGREITVGVLDDKVIGIIEIISDENFYNYKSKYVNVAKHILSPKLPKNIIKKLYDFTLAAHRSLGCNFISRADFRYNDKKNTLYLLEINTQPGLTKHSLLPEMANNIGIDFNELCNKILENAKCESL